ncbi:DUF3054 domain-containing protein [Ornithinimicrobium avium]|uniref:DUF3054 domain-containing protein n=1 Tax=Ornithinimicrobium avium TaxID=2283195 RepID=A0A345NJJ6_9MICO|nr:DUF3054 domain-containing protein [Ornithinimicrobium avium]AXH95204.1 DUF3054 domain-containing protein [Ornithinimicrobium avium]
MTRRTYVLDLLVVLLFALAGRASHDRGVDPLGVLETGWPFLVGTAVGWIAAAFVPRPMRSWWLEGIVVAVSALVVGMLLRWSMGEGTALPFVLVATGVLVVGLVGWRAVEAALARRA